MEKIKQMIKVYDFVLDKETFLYNDYARGELERGIQYVLVEVLTNKGAKDLDNLDNLALKKLCTKYKLPVFKDLPLHTGIGNNNRNLLDVLKLCEANVGLYTARGKKLLLSNSKFKFFCDNEYLICLKYDRLLFSLAVSEKVSMATAIGKNLNKLTSMELIEAASLGSEVVMRVR